MLKLYGHTNPAAANTLKIRVALAEAGAEYEYVALDLAKGEQRKPEFLAINPHGKVPVLVHDDFVLPESDACLWYVAETFPAARLLPEGTRGRARALEWCDFGSTALYPAYWETYQHTAFLAEDKRIASIAEAGRQRLDRALAVLEKVIGTREYLAGTFSIADIGVAAVLHWARVRLSIDAAAYPNTTRWFERVASRPTWQKAIG